MTKFQILLLVVALAAPALLVAASNYPPGYSSSQVTHVEHTAPRIETHPGNCVRIDWTTAKDAGAFLSGEPDAAAPDATAMGPRVLPKAGLNYECTSRNNAACLKQGMAIDSCNYTKYLPVDQPTAPFAFMPEPDGGQPKVFGVSTTGTANVECCPVMPSVMSGN